MAADSDHVMRGISAAAYSHNLAQCCFPDPKKELVVLMQQSIV